MREDYRSIGLMIESLNGYGSKILTGISRYAHQKPNWRIAYFDREQKELADLVGTWQGDGIICSAVDARFATAARSRSIPVINITGRHVEPNMINITSDDTMVGAMAANFLLERGFQSFGYLRRKEDHPLFHGSREGLYRNALGSGVQGGVALDWQRWG